MYKKALKSKLRFNTTKGKLTTEDLFDLNLTDLNNIAIALDKKLSETPRKSFISDITPDTQEDELRFNIVKDVITTKLAERDANQNAKAKAAAGSDARMNGCELPVVINSGSGNQGMTTSLPVIEYAKELNASREKLLATMKRCGVL